MASEARRAATALIDRRIERFESRHDLAQSQARLEAALPRAQMAGRVVFSPRWNSSGATPVLEAGFDPPASTQRFLRIVSIAMTLLIAATAWSIFSPAVNASVAWPLGIFTALAVLGLPFVFVGMGSSRKAEEARIRRAIRTALQDADPSLPPQQRWKDED
jgi:hypothetical protein